MEKTSGGFRVIILLAVLAVVLALGGGMGWLIWYFRLPRPAHENIKLEHVALVIPTEEAPPEENGVTAITLQPNNALSPSELDALFAEGEEKWPLQFRLEQVAQGLQAPDGLAIHPSSGELFIAEETPSRISIIRDGLQVVIDRETPIYTMHKGRKKKAAPLSMPEGIDFDAEGNLYVVEDRPGGRLLRFRNYSGRYPEGTVVPLPGDWSRFAWESVACGEKDTLLMAGSDIESVAGSSELTPYTGIILYRDEEGNWWVPYERLFASFSGVCFSKSGKHAIYIEEVMGGVGWIDLTTRQVLGGHSTITAKAPEGICVLPDGTFLIAQENGSVLKLDPGNDEHEVVVDELGAIESVLWDPGNQRALISADGPGKIFTLWPDRAISPHADAMKYAPFYPTYTPRHVPRECPEFLANVLALAGLDYTRDIRPPVTFRDFTSKVPLVAADAIAVPVLAAQEILNPIRRVQFVIFNPNQMAIDKDGSASLPLAAFAARKNDGEIIKTSMMQVESYFSAFDSAKFDPVDLARIAVPQAGPVSVSSLGIATVHLLGLGQGDDYSLVLNPRYRDDSYMVVYKPDGTRIHYRLDSPESPAGGDLWVIALAERGADTWALLGKAAEN
ncbi:MAG: hypothetical protein EOM20_11670 [Spartobacteria bacterium]|nr:hypothetical protein [Spartobacteria bacterium]